MRLNDKELLSCLVNGMKRALFCSIAVVAASAIASPPEWEGLYTYGHEVNSFHPCGSRQEYWVSTSPAINRQLRDFVTQHTSEIYQPVYLRLRGRLSMEKGDGFAADYDGLMNIQDVITFSEYAPVHCIPQESQ
ncbi:hypothetical protein [Kistimonas asteriae]|uniref:hypothetical protein n=1 Tax=Kistimonas asteriae TaxID=517724 RepID=UPI001BA4CBAA|nr:hypothetical protein [Kistimonas asteriae]